ncbi:hypothetical protein IW261DRAFT_1502130, partial [Armillaria novae-zelandiae]
MLPELKNFLDGVVTDLGIGDISCQSMRLHLELMSGTSFLGKDHMCLYGSHILSAVGHVVQAIAKAAGLQGLTIVLYRPVGQTIYAQGGHSNITVEHKWLENGQVRQQTVLVCSEEDEAYSVLLLKAEDLSRPLKLDATKEQTNANAMAVRVSFSLTWHLITAPSYTV